MREEGKQQTRIESSNNNNNNNIGEIQTIDALTSNLGKKTGEAVSVDRAYTNGRSREDKYSCTQKPSAKLGFVP